MTARKPGRATSTTGRPNQGSDRSRLSPTSPDRPPSKSSDSPQRESDRPSVTPNKSGTTAARPALQGKINPNAAASPNLVGQQVTVLKRGDTRPPNQIRESGGFHGWGGSMSVPHARQWVTQVWNAMSQSQQNNWMQTWKAQTSGKIDRVTYVATGLEEQKSGNVYSMKIPMPIEVPRVNARIIMNGATLEESTIIAVAGRGEIVFLSGIRLKYVEHNNSPL